MKDPMLTSLFHMLTPEVIEVLGYLPFSLVHLFHAVKYLLSLYRSPTLPFIPYHLPFLR